MTVPLILCGNPKAQYLAHQDEINAAIQRVLNGDRYILGSEVKTFESAFAAYIGVDHGIGVGSGTDAIHVALAACGIGQGDEVITVSHTAVATVAAIELAGATPVLVDIERGHFTMDPRLLEAALTPRTKAIIPVHLYGQMADMSAILPFARKHGLRVIEDCAQCHGVRQWGDIAGVQRGARAGSLGDMACFSFYPTKNLGAIGDGGMVVTADAALAERARLYREYGWAERYVSHIRGTNSRLDELQAAILRVKLTCLDADNEKRCRIADIYDSQLPDRFARPERRGLAGTHVFHLYVLRVPERDVVVETLRKKSIIAMIHYPVPIHKQPAYAGRLSTPGGMLETERAAHDIVSLPMYPELTESDVMRVVDALS